MRRFLPFVVLGPLAVGCGGNDSALSGAGNGLYGAPARDARERDSLVSSATKELGKGVSAAIAEASGPFGFRLIQESGVASNVVVSPLSVATALSMTLNGAAGETQTQMLNTLGYKKTSALQVNEASRSIRMLLGNVDPTVQLRVANSIWAKEGAPFQEAFLQSNESAYGAKTTRLDFAAPDALDSINRWVKEATNSKIDKMLDKLDPATEMILLNAVYFKGEWRTPFAKELTRDGVFTASDGAKRTVPMMNLTASLPYIEEKGWTATAFPYGNGRLEMVVILPNGKLEDVTKALAGGLPKSLSEMKETRIKAGLPKFQASYEEVLNKPLQELGMKLAFTAGADFSPMATDKLMISEVRHKTLLDIDEQGSEAAASASVSMVRGAAPSAKEFIVNKPFALMIREKETGLVLFAAAIRSVGELPKTQ